MEVSNVEGISHPLFFFSERTSKVRRNKKNLRAAGDFFFMVFFTIKMGESKIGKKNQHSLGQNKIEKKTFPGGKQNRKKNPTFTRKTKSEKNPTLPFLAKKNRKKTQHSPQKTD